MAQDPGKMSRNPRGSVYTSSTGLSSPSDTEHLRRQIAETRAGMTDTIDAIQDRVHPRNLIKRAKESFKESTVERVKNIAEAAGNTAGYLVARTAKTRTRVKRITQENPVPAIVVSVAAVWLLLRALRRTRRREYLYEEPAF